MSTTDTADTFGPQWELVVALVRRVAVLTTDEASQFAAASITDPAAARDVAWDSVWDTGREAAWHAARDAVWDAARDAAWHATQAVDLNAVWVTARYAAWHAVWALAIRDLIGQQGFTQEHYDLLTRPWRTVIGCVHRDDPEADRG